MQSENSLLELEFESVDEYLSLLKTTCEAVDPLGSRALIYCAAAVSDFYIPHSELPHDKIQSDGNGLSLELKPVSLLISKDTHQTLKLRSGSARRGRYRRVRVRCSRPVWWHPP